MINIYLILINYYFQAPEIALARYILQFFLMITIIKCNKSNPLGPIKHRKLLIIRACFGTFGLIFYFFAFKILHPSDCLAIIQTSVIITSIFARIFLNERLTFAHLIAIALTSAGVILIAKPKALFENFDQNNETISMNLSINETIVYNCSNYKILNNVHERLNTTIGILIALCCALCYSTVEVLLKKLSAEKVEYSIPIIYVTYIGIPVTFIISLEMALAGVSHQNFSNNLNMIPLQFLYVVVGAVLGIISQTLLNFSLKYEDASKIAIVRTIDVFLTFILQYIFLNISLDTLSLVGASSILSGTFLILSFKFIESRMNGKKENINLFTRFIKFNF